jgi:hypothetical protein
MAKENNFEIFKELMAGEVGAVLAFQESLSAESDRGCALMAAAYLDSELQRLLCKYLVNDEPTQKEIFGNSRPLGSFSSKIDLAYLVGLLGPNAHRDLHLIRRVRNEFGHVPTAIDFDNPSLASRCNELYHDASGKKVSPRAKFIRVSLGVLGVIHASLYSITGLEEAKDVSMETAKEYMELLSKIIDADPDA